ncbi:unnamed protein product [Cuscuta epithymum]|uniref:Uncharacterized protein n=1 Tax=Cuscuta epithymum TaxID=186058 RepID=A0AAV0BZR5_9ASTE|nr:unnamed protein product [Cuscuta epithymum]
MVRRGLGGGGVRKAKKKRKKYPNRRPGPDPVATQAGPGSTNPEPPARPGLGPTRTRPGPGPSLTPIDKVTHHGSTTIVTSVLHQLTNSPIQDHPPHCDKWRIQEKKKDWCTQKLYTCMSPPQTSVQLLCITFVYTYLHSQEKQLLGA